MIKWKASTDWKLFEELKQFVIVCKNFRNMILMCIFRIQRHLTKNKTKEKFILYIENK